ncbi:MAG: hypothetical protein GY810_02135 [Aureispira sp.]|nr:hypothetical protein [Aureispira sp.]
MRYLLYTLTFFIIAINLPTDLSGQGHNGKFGNEWIDYDLTYYKISVAEDGMHRVAAQVLQSEGMDMTKNPANFRLFHMGKEIPIHVELSGSTIDYIQFYGVKNRGEYDVHLYDNKNHHFNPEYSLIVDTSAYFLTWDPTTAGKQFTTTGANLSNIPAAENYFMHESKTVFKSYWNKGKQYQIATEQLTKSSFEFGEGYGSALAKNRAVTITTDNKYASGPDAEASIKVYGRSQVSHNLDISIGGTSYVTSYYVSDSIWLHQFNFPVSQIGSSTTIDVDGTGAASDQYYVSFGQIRYPHTFNFYNQPSFKFSTEGSARKYFTINDFDGSNNNTTSDIYLYDLTDNHRVQCVWSASQGQVLTDLPAGVSQDRELVLVNEALSSSYVTVGKVNSTTFTDFSSIGYLNRDYVIVTHPRLTKTSTGLNPVLEYEAYRASTGFIPVTVDIQQLYDQFAYGINYHPLAVRHFAHYIKRTWANPEYIFLIGKGRVYKDMRNSQAHAAQSLLIPTMGYPPSDNKMLAYIGSNIPAIPVGRLAATTGDQVKLYLEKIKALEGEQQLAQTLPDRGWMKNILHLGGGSNSNEQNIIKLHLNNMKSIAEGTYYGGNVESFFKTSASPIQAAQSSYLDSLINSGVSVITFFGHSSASSFDFNLDYPSNYSNKDRYPLIMALGCYGGTISSAAPAISEAFVFEEYAGASVFLASTGAAALSALNQFANKFYRQMAVGSYGHGAARMVQKAIQDLEQGGIYTTTMEMVANYITYHGDPALKLNAQDCPDYYIDETLVSHSPDLVTIQQDSFALELDLYNIGKAIDTVFYVNIEREYADGTQEYVVQKQVTAPYFNGVYKFPIATGDFAALGLNKFTITIDANDDINECGENNNIVLDYYIYILSDAILPVYPYEFAIVPNQNIKLKASTGNVFAAPQTYRIQIDTTAYYNSPLMLETTVTQGGGVVEWTPPTTYLDSTVYYWRVSPDSINSQTAFQWAQSSFIHIGGSYPGWNQSHFFQYLRDNHTNIEIEEPNREFEYINTIQDISVRNGYVNPNLTPNPILQDYLALYFNGKQLDKCRCLYENGVYVTVVEPTSSEVWEMPQGGASVYGAINCDGAKRKASSFLFETDLTAGKAAFESFLRDTIPNGHYVMIHTLNNAYAQFWSPSLISLLKDEGAQYLDDLQNDPDGLPYAFFYKKGDSSYVHKASVLGPDRETEINLLGKMQENWYQGKQTSTVIGPANDWGSFHWRTSSLDGLNTDNVTVDIYGINSTQTTQVLLMDDITALDTFLTTIDAQQYPYLQLVWNTTDATHKTSLQLDYWRVLADMMPEAALRPDIYYSLQSDTIQQGTPISLDITMENISDTDMDSMLVYYAIPGATPPQEKYVRMAPLPAGDTLVGHVTFPSVSLEGEQYLYVEINPNKDQLEKHHFNNYGFLLFNIVKDIINPIMDVTFDGVHIMNGDIVSGKPEVVVYLTDENKSLALDELEDFQVILQDPSGVQHNLLDGSIPIQFYPADAGRVAIENKARIVMNPDLLQDGTYTLFVSATDKSGNNSGDLNYSVDFEVINKASISNILNYPNPFTTSTQFVFTLTGREIPDYMKIQILTVSGKIVKEIGMEELGPIRVGVNRTEYAWDGTDQFGDQLANGVYLYRVVTQKNGENYERYNSSVDYMFRRGFGKMYLMR